jgi:precorrin-3B synthase
MADCPGIFLLAQMKDGGLARLRLPGGRLSAVQARAVADVARRWGNGVVDLTNRANLQIRGLPAVLPDAAVARLDAAGLVPAMRGADRLRNITADPLSGLDDAVDVGPLVAALDAALQAADLDGLSPKFAFVLDGGGRSRIAGVLHDVGFIACPGGFRLSLGGRLSDEVIAAGDVVDRALAEARAILASGSRRPGRIGRLDPWLGPVPQRDGAVALALDVPVARADADLLDRLAGLAADGLRLTPWSAVVLPGIAAERVAAAVAASGLRTAVGLRVVACAGSTGCDRGLADTKADGRRLAAAVGDSGAGTVHLAGCSKGCAHPGAADILALARSDGRYDLHCQARPAAAGAAWAEGVGPAEMIEQLARAS